MHFRTKFLGYFQCSFNEAKEAEGQTTSFLYSCHSLMKASPTIPEGPLLNPPATNSIAHLLFSQKHGSFWSMSLPVVSLLLVFVCFKKQCNLPPPAPSSHSFSHLYLHLISLFSCIYEDPKSSNHESEEVNYNTQKLTLKCVCLVWAF